MCPVDEGQTFLWAKLNRLQSGYFQSLCTRHDGSVHLGLAHSKDALHAREFALLEFLMRNPGRVISKTTILEHVYDYAFDPGTNVVDVLVHRLRSKIDKGFDTKLLHTVRGMGYVLREA